MSAEQNPNRSQPKWFLVYKISYLGGEVRRYEPIYSDDELAAVAEAGLSILPGNAYDIVLVPFDPNTATKLRRVLMQDS